ncbi:hypothetical protein EMPS_05910 [Entomortierella parvispora]|uniref:BAR-domain-containing protein n=1 Tax=Entomortierella parvispora TaxID=205924 RepID=A0A9P3LWY7_9FUNG|nr:hypothetical protein EMPS_05910 [Entomortierella parvispora]
MIKNIGKFKQWTGEKMGKTQRTRMDEDFNSLTTETDNNRIALEKLNVASQAYFKAISKRVEGDDKYKGLAVETFGMSMSAQSYTLREGSAYREALHQMGDAHQAIGAAQAELVSRFGSSYIDCLERAQMQMKDYQALQKKLHSRRLDYDAKLAKVQKAKKEKPEWEEEMQAAKAKYEETREHVLGIMAAIHETQDENVVSLKTYYDAQLTYARRVVEILEAIPEGTFDVSAYEPVSSQRLYRQSSYEPDEDRSNHSDDHSSVHSASASGPRARIPLNRAPSSSELRRQPTLQRQPSDLSRSMSHLGPNTAHVRKPSIAGGRSTGHMPPPPPTLPIRTSPQKQVRALYNFEATADGELSLQKGDIVRIIEEIDEGWWEGEIVDSRGVRHEGMFPSNYCEEIQSDTGSPQRQSSVHSNNSDSGRYVDEDEAAYYARESELPIQYDEPEVSFEPEPAVHLPVARRAPPPPSRHPHGMMLETHLNGASSLTSPTSSNPRPTPPTSRPGSAAAPTNRIGSRAPPPPPPARRGTSHEAMRQSTTFPNGPGTPPLARPAEAHTESVMRPCRECNCTDFTANVFKRGSCNNCFHTH